MRSRRVVGGMVGAVCLPGLLGCPPREAMSIRQPPGPPRTLEEIVSTIETNAALLDRALWSNSVTVKARLTDAQGNEHSYNLDGSFLFRRPRSLRMDLRPGLGERVMQIGSNAEDYWLWIEPEMGTMWWGRHRHADKPCAGSMSVRPDQLAAALVLGGLPGSADGLIGPARKFGKTYDVLYYLRERPAGRYVLDREYLVKRRPPHLVEVVRFRDGLGRIVMSALLEDYRRAWDGGPLVPHTVNVIWPENDAKFTLWIDRMTGKPAGKVSEKAFVRPTAGTLPSGVEQVIQVDRDCDPPEASEGIDAAHGGNGG